ANSIRPFFRQAGDPCCRSSLSVEQPMPRICVRLTPIPQVFRHPRSSGGTSTKPRAAWRGGARGSNIAMSAKCQRTASSSTHEWHARRLGLRLRRPRETLNDFDQLLVHSTPWVAKMVDRMFVPERAQAQQLAGALAPVQLQL